MGLAAQAEAYVGASPTLEILNPASLESALRHLGSNQLAGFADDHLLAITIAYSRSAVERGIFQCSNGRLDGGVNSNSAWRAGAGRDVLKIP